MKDQDRTRTLLKIMPFPSDGIFAGDNRRIRGEVGYYFHDRLVIPTDF